MPRGREDILQQAHVRIARIRATLNAMEYFCSGTLCAGDPALYRNDEYDAILAGWPNRRRLTGYSTSRLSFRALALLRRLLLRKQRRPRLMSMPLAPRRG